MLLNHLAELLVNRLKHIVMAFFGKRFAQNTLEGFLLLSSGNGGLQAENRLNELRVVLCEVAGIVQGIVYVGASVVKGREEETKLRRRNKPVRP